MKWVDDFVWERYKTWRGQVDFKALLKASTFWGISWTSGVRDYADMKANEHGANYSNLMRFRESLHPDLRDCVDPFLEQQEKLESAYRCIYYGLYLSPSH
jgi:hypothetical protein